MAYDPLSDSTRKNRRALLSVASAAILVEIFGVRIKTISAIGLTIEAPEQLLSVVLAAGTGYFLITFFTFLLDDLVNRPQAEYLNRTQTNLDSYMKEELAHQIRNAFSKDIERMPHLESQIRKIADNLCEKNLSSHRECQDVMENDYTLTLAESFANHQIDVGSSKDDYDNLRDDAYKSIIDVVTVVYRKMKKSPTKLHISKIKHRQKIYRIFSSTRLYFLEIALPLMLGFAGFALVVWGLLESWSHSLNQITGDLWR